MVKAGDSIENPDNNPHGARGVSLSDLITERKELLKASVDQQQLAASTSTESSTPAPDVDARGDQQRRQKKQCKDVPDVLPKHLAWPAIDRPLIGAEQRALLH